MGEGYGVMLVCMGNEEEPTSQSLKKMALQESCYALKPSRGEWQKETQLGCTRVEGKPYRES